MNQKILMPPPLESLAVLPVQKSKRRPRLLPAEKMGKREEGRKKLAENIGKTFGFLTVTSLEPSNGRHTMVGIRCVCGIEKKVRFSHIGHGTQSCGCKRVSSRVSKVKTHGHHLGGKTSKTKNAYNSMFSRCYREKNDSYERYHSRGIKVCDRWLFGEEDKTGFVCFLNDMGDPPTKDHSLDRINNDLGYSPENCRWATWEQQHNNRENSRYIEYNGENLTITQWAKKLGCSDVCLHYRLKAWSVEKALSTPIIKRANSRRNTKEL